MFDRTANRILLTGNVALSDGPNVTTGERIVYDLNTSIANVETESGRAGPRLVRARLQSRDRRERRHVRAGQAAGASAPDQLSMMPKSGCRFSEDIMLNSLESITSMRFDRIRSNRVVI